MTNPIIQRELLGLLRRPSTLVMCIALIAVTGGLVVAMWPDNATVSLDGRQAQQLFRVFIYGLLVCLLLAVPAFPATAIVRERNSGTLALVLTSPLRPRDILVGKVSAAVGFVVLLLALSVPATVACFVMGGIDLAQIVKAYGVLALMAVQYAMVALLISSFARSADAALRLTYGCVLAMAVIVLGPYLLMQGKLVGPLGAALVWLYCLSPIPAITELLNQGDVGSLGYLKDFDPVARYMLLAVLTAAGCGAWLTARLQPRLLDRSRAAGKVTDDRSAGVQAYRRLMYLWFFDPQRRTTAIGGHTNPVMVKEFRTRALGRSHWMMRMIGLCLMVSLGLMLLAANWATDNPEQNKTAYLGGILVAFQMALIVLTAPALSAGLISVELESGGWQLLQLTRLRPRQIVVGKLLSVAATLGLLLIATLPGYAVLWFIDAEQYLPRIVNVLICLLLTAAFSLMLGAACSALFRKTAITTTIAYGVLVVLCVGTLVMWLGQGALFSQQLAAKVLALNPVATALAVMKVPGFEVYAVPLNQFPWWTALVGALPGGPWRTYVENAPFNWLLLVIGSIACAALLWIRTWRLSRPQ